MSSIKHLAILGVIAGVAAFGSAHAEIVTALPEQRGGLFGQCRQCDVGELTAPAGCPIDDRIFVRAKATEPWTAFEAYAKKQGASLAKKLKKQRASKAKTQRATAALKKQLDVLLGTFKAMCPVNELNEPDPGSGDGTETGDSASGGSGSGGFGEIPLPSPFEFIGEGCGMNAFSIAPPEGQHSYAIGISNTGYIIGAGYDRSTPIKVTDTLGQIGIDPTLKDVTYKSFLATATTALPLCNSATCPNGSQPSLINNKGEVIGVLPPYYEASRGPKFRFKLETGNSEILSIPGITGQVLEPSALNDVGQMAVSLRSSGTSSSNRTVIVSPDGSMKEIDHQALLESLAANPEARRNAIRRIRFPESFGECTVEELEQTVLVGKPRLLEAPAQVLAAVRINNAGNIAGTLGFTLEWAYENPCGKGVDKQYTMAIFAITSRGVTTYHSELSLHVAWAQNEAGTILTTVALEALDERGIPRRIASVPALIDSSAPQSGFTPVPLTGLLAEFGSATGLALNSQRDVVGMYSNRFAPQDFSQGTWYRAFASRGGKALDLTSCLPANSGWTLFSATGINDKGEIVGTAYNSSRGIMRGYLLSPKGVR